MATQPQLYPLKFHPIFQERIWGGDKIKTVLGKDFSPVNLCGESWEVSGVDQNISVVKGGPLDGKDLRSLIDEYQGQLVGKAVYTQFGNEFPLLIKFLDAREDLSIQVHPDDTVGRKRHNSAGKTEMWYVLEADPGATMRVGFNRNVDKETYLNHLNRRKLDEILNIMPVQEDDTVFLPAGRIHSIGAGLLIAEIQQTSDITYRVYDFDRRDAKGNLRELHTGEAVDVIDYNAYPDYRTKYHRERNEVAELVECPYFVTNRLHFDQAVTRDYTPIDSFVILICTEGKLTLQYNSGSTQLVKGESILIPATIKNVELWPEDEFKVLETYFPAKQ